MTALGILLSFARREPGAAEAISARFGAVRRSVSIRPAPREAGAATGTRRPRRSRRGKGAKGAKKSAARAAPTTSAPRSRRGADRTSRRIR